MPITFSEQFNVSAKVLELTGVFDVILDIDTRVLVDPALLELCTEPEFLDARKKDCFKLSRGATDKVIYT